ncbi:SEC14 [Symbiodinium sp. KB8]|nr:SEC14 [Symbiodinium sp. KB8]
MAVAAAMRHFPPWPSTTSSHSRAQVPRDDLLADPAAVANGFRVLPENSSIEIEEHNVAAFSLPQEVLSFQPDDQAVFARFANGDCERKLHCNIELNHDELEALRLLQEEARAHRVALPVSISASATRYLSHSHGDPKKALKMMEATTEWRSSFFTRPLSDADMAEDLKLGLAYFTGRDKALRPVLVFRAARIPAAWHRERRYDQVIRVLVFCMEYFLRYMAVPGKIESLNVVIDLKDLSLSQIPIGVLREVHRSMGMYYVGRIFRFYICNMPRILGTLVPLAKKVLTERQRQKLVFVCRPEDITKDMAERQIEEDLGGSRPPLKEFFPFPLLPGPFEPNMPPSPRCFQEAVPGVHKVLTAEGSRGRLWNWRVKPEENQRLEFSDCAADIFRKCGLPVPAEIAASAPTPSGGKHREGVHDDERTPREVLITNSMDEELRHPEAAVVSDESTKDSLSNADEAALDEPRGIRDRRSKLQEVEVVQRRRCCLFSGCGGG